MIKRTLFSPVDSVVFISGIACVCLGLYLYSHNSFNLIDSQNGKLVGLHLNGEGTQKNLGNLFWTPLLEKSSVYNGDKLFANKEEDVTIKLLKSGLVVNIPKDSLVVIYEEDDSVSFSLDKGVIQVSSAPKDTLIKIKDQSGSIKALTLEAKSNIEVKRSKGTSDIKVNNGKAYLFDNLAKTSSEILPNTIVKIKDQKVTQISMRDFVPESQIDLSKKRTLSISAATSKSIEFLTSLDKGPVTKLAVVNGEVDVSSLKPGEYFVRQEGSSDFDKVLILSSNTFIPKIVNNKSELLYGEPLSIEWDGIKDSAYNVSVIKPDGSLTKAQVLGTSAQVVVPIGGEYKIQITKVEKTSLALSSSLFNSDDLFKESMASLEQDEDVRRLKDENQSKLTSKDKTLVYSEKENNDLTFKYQKPNFTILSEKTSLVQNRERQQVSRTNIVSGTNKLELYERSNLERNIPALKKAKLINGANKEELILRYDQTGGLTSLTLREGKNVIDQSFVDGKLTASTENKKEFKGAALKYAAIIPTSLSAFIDLKIPPSISEKTDVQPSYSSINVKVKPPVSLLKSEDLIDKNDNYIKKLQFQTDDKNKFRYTLENSKGVVVAASALAPSIDFKNQSAGNYLLKVQAPNNQIEIISENITIKPRIQILTKVDDLELNEKEKIFEIPLKWDSPNKENRLEIFKDNIEEPIFSQVVSGGRFNYKTKDLSGLKWKVSAEVDSVIPSKIVDIVKPPVLKELPISGAVVMKFQKKLGGCYEFTLPTVKFAQKYFIEVYEGADRSKMIFNRWLNDNSLCWQSSKHGKYFYRYKYFDKWGAQSDFSKMGEIIFPISPLTEF